MSVLRDRGYRAVTVAALLALIVAMTVHYGAVAAREGHDRARVDAEKLAGYEPHVGERLYVWGEVLEGTDGGLRILAAGRTLTVRTDTAASPGDVVQVYGSIRPGGTIAAERVIVSERGHLRYLYAVSAVGLLLAVAAFFRKWEVRWRRLRVAPRGDDD